MEQRFYIISEYGLHARPASKLVQLSMGYPCEINLIWQNKTINLKSIMGLMSLGIYHGETVKIEALGDSEEKALKAISDFLVTEHIGRIL
jgi:phosphocarrier protein